MLYVWYDKIAGCVCASELHPGVSCSEYPDYTIQDSNRFYSEGELVKEKTAEQLEAERVAKLSKKIRDERDKKLAACDWTQLPDAMVDKAAWATYRQALRDVPQQPGFPETILWPEKPLAK